jgi:hypothetical protein
MKNTTNWYLYTASKSEKKTKKSTDPKIENSNIQEKLKLIEKAFK